MTTQTLHEPVHAQTTAEAATHGLLVASDGTAASTPALAMARLVARDADDVHVLSVVEPLPVPMPAAGMPVYVAPDENERAQNLLQHVRRQSGEMLGVTPTSVAVTVGSPVEMITTHLRRHGEALVITGRGQHGRLGRLLHGETPLAIARASHTPVLVVPRTPQHLPRVAVIAVDLDGAALNAARRARPLLREAREVYLVHVRRHPAAVWEMETGRWEQFYSGLTQSEFDRVIHALDLPDTARAETRTLTGHPVEELLEFAEYVQAELLVSGYRRRLLIDRLTGPRSVAERVFRAAACAMLLVPEPAETAPHLAHATETASVTDHDRWGAELLDFTTRNAGRTANLEVDTLDLGAQAQVVGYPFMGVDHDRDAGVVHIMLGRGHGTPHITHAIEGVTAIEIYRRQMGPDIALRVVHEGGYSVLSLRDRAVRPPHDLAAWRRAR